MATSAGIRIDQIVHGYERGHSELARSLELDDEARAIMLVMSDLLVDQALDAQGSYLSCYPLRSAAMHVLARTWPAGPRFRPGSVWTHSLLVPYQALAQLPDLAALLGYLRKPDGRLDWSHQPVFVETGMSVPALPFDTHAARLALAGIYSRQPSQIVQAPSTGIVQNEGLALSLWRQAWPGLRRDFAFITDIAERTTIQDAGCLLRFTNEPVSPVTQEPGLDILLEDLRRPGNTELRQFLSRYAVESSDPRAVASELADIWAQGAAGESGRKIAAFADLSRSQRLPRLRRDLIVSELASTASSVNLLDLVVEFGDESISDLPRTVRQKISEATSVELKKLLSIGLSSPEGVLARLISDEIIAQLDLQSLASIADQTSRPKLLSSRPELVRVSAFWPSSDPDRASLVRGLSEEEAFSVDDAVLMFGPAIGRETAGALVLRVAAREPRSILGLVRHENATIKQAAANIIGSDDEIIGLVLSSLDQHDQSALDAIAGARITSPARLGNPLPWIRATEKVISNGPPETVSSAYCALLLTCAVKLGGGQGLEAANRVFEPVFNAVRNYRLGRNEERWLERELPDISMTYSLRSRLAAAVVLVWPPRDGQAGSMLLCQGPDSARDLVDQVDSRFGRSALWGATKDLKLPAAAADAIELKLHPPRPRLGWFGL